MAFFDTGLSGPGGFTPQRLTQALPPRPVSASQTALSSPSYTPPAGASNPSGYTGRQPGLPQSPVSPTMSLAGPLPGTFTGAGVAPGAANSRSNSVTNVPATTPSPTIDPLTGKPMDLSLYANAGPYSDPASNYKYVQFQASQGNYAPAASAGFTVPQQQGGPAASPFGDNPFMSNPTETNPLGGTTALNPRFYATQDTANAVAQKYGGTVVATSPLNSGSGFATNQPQYMVRLPNGTMINPGDVASLYTHGYSQSYIDGQLQQLLNGGINANVTPLTASQQSQVLANNIANGNIPGGGSYVGPSNNPSTPSTNPSGSDQFSQLISQLYGSDPFSAAFGGNTNLGNLLAQATSGGSMYNIAALLNSLYSYRSQPSGILSPLFWGSQGMPSGFSNGNYYPSYY